MNFILCVFLILNLFSLHSQKLLFQQVHFSAQNSFQMVPKLGTDGHFGKTEDPQIGNRLEILYNEYFYDVTDFVERHPGGNIIKYYTQKGEDASQAIRQFHNRSISKIHLMLKSFKKRPATDSDVAPMDSSRLQKHREMTKDFSELFLEIEKEGLFKPSYRHIMLRLLEVIGIWFIANRIIGLGSTNPLIHFIYCFTIAICVGRATWAMHECGHHSFTGRPKVDKFIQSVYMGVFLGLSAGWWRRRHNKHHAMPQRLDHDLDVNTMPLVAHNVNQLKDPKQGNTFFIRNQTWLFLTFDCMLSYLVWKIYVGPRSAYRYGNYLDLLMMGVNWYLTCNYWFFMPSFTHLVISLWLGSVYMFGNFSLNHMHLPLTEEQTHWVEYALIHTANIKSNLLCDWWMGHLNFQIEHHLFPTLPEFRCYLVQDRVKALAKKYDLPYHNIGYWEAWKITMSNFHDVANHFKEF